MNRESQMLSSAGTQVTSVCALREGYFKARCNTELAS